MNVSDVLSARERQVSRYVAFGMRNMEVASKLSISPNTVRTHVSRILRKLGLRSRHQVAGCALEMGII
jgi:DNA-binding CsgD family transcriptional regulator